jgi:hypothetical protein
MPMKNQAAKRKSRPAGRKGKAHEPVAETPSGGAEDLMVDGRGGTLPLRKSELPHYLDRGTTRRRSAK